MAFRVYGLLANGMGGLDWAGLPVIAEWLGVQDMDDLLHRLAVIKAHRSAADREDKPGQPAD